MPEPSTSLDTRFSDSDATPTTWVDAVRILESAELFWITTVRDDGRPHVTPLVAVWLAGALYFSTGADEQKAVNLRTNSHVILTTGCNQWDGGLDVVVEGEASRVTDQSTLEHLADAWRTKWDGRWRFEAPRRCLPSRDRRGLRLRGVTQQGAGLREGCLHPHPPPVLMAIPGTADPMFPIEHAEALVQEISGATLLVLEGAGHGVEAPDWEAIVAAILRHSAAVTPQC